MMRQQNRSLYQVYSCSAKNIRPGYYVFGPFSVGCRNTVLTEVINKARHISGKIILRIVKKKKKKKIKL